MTKVAPSLLAADFMHLAEQIIELEKAGCDLLHLDIMDGHFVPNLSFGPFIVKQINAITDLPLDVHLMIANPEKYIDRYLDAGADYLTVHGEVIGADPTLLKQIKSAGAKAGLSLNPDADIMDYRDLFVHLDLFLVMSVYAGFGGQKFIENVLEQVRKAVSFRDEMGLDFKISIDGGINLKTAALARQAGVDILVAGTALFSAADIGHFIRELRG
ncbi:MAG: ribulose-phosphate 3-epimerase [candidate division Zixibacteria bacterium]|nr:ribulose-phosphate 3-epimerase [candidate division Zixibacteria bacterium]